MNTLYIVLLLLVITRVFAELAERVNMPAILGELIAGVALGIALIYFSDSMPVLWSATQSDAFGAMVDLGMFFLMLLAGIFMEPLEFARASRSAILIAIGGMIIPLAAGVLLGLSVIPASPFQLVQCLFLGTALAVTAVPVTMRIFMELEYLDSRAGKAVVAAALWDDLLSLFLLAVLLASVTQLETGVFQAAAIAALVGKVALFFAVTIPVGLYVFPFIGHRLRYLRFPEVEFSMLLIAALAYAVFAEFMGLHFILGAFLAGMFFHPGVVEVQAYQRVAEQMSGLTRGFLAPIFFVSIGLHLDFSAMAQVPLFVVALILIAFASKLLGCGLPAYWVGMSKRESAIVGIGMSGRGAVELIIAGVALNAGLFAVPQPTPVIVDSLFSAVVIMALVTTVLTSIFLNWLVRHEP